jgi:hypothetical protein
MRYVSAGSLPQMVLPAYAAPTVPPRCAPLYIPLILPRSLRKRQRTLNREQQGEATPLVMQPPDPWGQCTSPRQHSLHDTLFSMIPPSTISPHVITTPNAPGDGKSQKTTRVWGASRTGWGELPVGITSGPSCARRSPGSGGAHITPASLWTDIRSTRDLDRARGGSVGEKSQEMREKAQALRLGALIPSPARLWRPFWLVAVMGLLFAMAG